MFQIPTGKEIVEEIIRQLNNIDVAPDMMDSVEENWSDRDALPTKDPIGDVEDEYVSGYNKWKKDQEAYENQMKNRLLVPEGKVSFNDFKGLPVMEGDNEPKCDCGVAKTYKNHTLRMHSSWCALRRNSAN